MPLVVNFKAILDRLQKKAGPQEIIAFDFSLDEIKCARLRQAGGKVHLVAAEVLPPLQLVEGHDRKRSSSINLPKNLICRHAVLCLPGKDAIVKLLNLPGRLDSDSESKIREDMGMGGGGGGGEGGEHRIGYKVLGYSHTRIETKLLTVALPETLIRNYLGYFSVGWPVPVSVEVAGLAAINAFISGYLVACPDETIGVVQFENQAAFFAFLHKKELVLIRKYDFGYNHILSAIQSRLNVNRETAFNVASDQSFDISQMVKEVCDAFVRQIVISKHFVERRENCRVSRIFIPGSAVASQRLAHEIHVASEVEINEWDPLKAVAYQPESIGQKFAGQHSLFAALAGAGIGFFGETTS